MPFANALMPPLSSVTGTEIELSRASSCAGNGLYAVSVEYSELQEFSPYLVIQLRLMQWQMNIRNLSRSPTDPIVEFELAQ
jgi:hypothetical protein